MTLKLHCHLIIIQLIILLIQKDKFIFCSTTFYVKLHRQYSLIYYWSASIFGMTSS